MVDIHTHNGTDSPQLDGKRALRGAPQSSLTAKNSTGLSTGGAAVLSASDSAIIDNMRTRINELETKLTNLGLLRQ